MKKQMKYRQYSIRKNYDEYEVFIGLFKVFPCSLPSINRAKIAINLWWKYSMNPPKFLKYFKFLTVNRYNYNGVYGKLISISKLKEISKS